MNACVRADGCTDKTREYNLMGSQKTRDEYELMGAQKIDAYKMTDSQKCREYNLMGALNIDEYDFIDSQKIVSTR